MKANKHVAANAVIKQAISIISTSGEFPHGA